MLARLGSTDLEISRHGFGAARIGAVPLERIEGLLRSLPDLGITFIDTADCYTRSEEIIGRCLADRIGEFVIATKCGCITAGEQGEAYSRPVIERSIDRSLERLGVERLDLVFLHTCSAKILRAGEAAEALLRARDAGKVRCTGYSGDGEDAMQAISMGIFDALQVTFNILSQEALDGCCPPPKPRAWGWSPSGPSPMPGCCPRTRPSITAALAGIRCALC